MTITGLRRVPPVVYPSSDERGEHEIQRFITELLRPLVERLLRERGVVAHVGADTFFYQVEGDPRTCIAPDVYAVPGVPQSVRVASWLLWENGAPPSFALEVVGGDIDKDYVDAPHAHAQLGTEELVIFDPHWTPRSRRRVRWQHYRRNARGALRSVASHNEDRIHSPQLDAWLRVARDHDGQTVVRLGTGERGETLLRTDREQAERVEAEYEAETTARAALATANATLESANAALRARRAALTPPRRR